MLLNYTRSVYYIRYDIKEQWKIVPGHRGLATARARTSPARICATELYRVDTVRSLSGGARGQQITRWRFLSFTIHTYSSATLRSKCCSDGPFPPSAIADRESIVLISPIGIRDGDTPGHVMLQWLRRL